MSEVEKLVTKLTVAGERGWTVRGQPCDGDIMLEAAATITRLSEENERLRELVERALHFVSDYQPTPPRKLAAEMHSATQGESSHG